MPPASDAPSDSPSARRTTPTLLCRGCGYNLGGHRSTDGIVTCPECGRSGPWASVIMPPIGRQLGRAERLLWMSMPMMLCFGAGLVLSACSIGMFGGIGFLEIGCTIVGLLLGVFAPISVASYVIDHTPPREASSAATGTLFAGWGLNFGLLLLLITIRVLSLR